MPVQFIKTDTPWQSLTTSHQVPTNTELTQDSQYLTTPTKLAEISQLTITELIRNQPKSINENSTYNTSQMNISGPSISELENEFTTTIFNKLPNNNQKQENRTLISPEIIKFINKTVTKNPNSRKTTDRTISKVTEKTMSLLPVSSSRNTSGIMQSNSSEPIIVKLQVFSNASYRAFPLSSINLTTILFFINKIKF